VNQGRSLELKKAFFARIAENLAKTPGLRKEDVLVNLVEVPKRTGLSETASRSTRGEAKNDQFRFATRRNGL
jgi:Tautomerase enzyme